MSDPQMPVVGMAKPQRFKVVLYISLKFHPVATCQNCQQATHGPRATLWTKEHVRRTGHTVTIERVEKTEYGPEREDAVL